MKIILTIFLFFGGTFAQELESILANQLPIALSNTASIYDGDDSIFIFGGYHRDQLARPWIYRLNISSNALTSVASFPKGLYAGVAVKDATGNIYYVGGDDNRNRVRTVYKFNPVDNSIQLFGSLTNEFSHGSVVPGSNPDEFVLLGRNIGLGEKDVRCISLNGLISCGESQLQNGAAGSASFVHNGKAFIFSRHETGLEVLDLEDLTSIAGPTTIQDNYNYGSVVYDGKYGYVVGGYSKSADKPLDALIRFDPETFDFEFIPVKNLLQADYYKRHNFESMSSVYVPKLKRIYLTGGDCFYGSSYQWEQLKGIRYIDLSPLSK